MPNNPNDNLSSGARFVLGGDHSNRIEVDFFNLYAWLLQYVDSKKVLDVACGSGLGSFVLAHKAREVLGLDVSEEAVAFAQKNYTRDNLTFRIADGVHFDYPAKYFDVIVSAMTIEQIAPERQIIFLQRLADSLRDDGLLILVTPNRKINNPFGSKAVGNPINQSEFCKEDLLSLFRQTRLEPIGWFGRRRVRSFLTLTPIRLCMSAMKKLTGKSFGLYGARECPAVLPVNRWWQPKDFVVVLRKAKK
jgi:SAM-dependent methyltransferase